MTGQTPPPPKASPGVPLGEEHDTPTGEHPVTKRELKSALNLNDVKTGVAMVVVAVGAIFGAYKIVLTDAKAQTDAGVEKVNQKFESYKQKTDEAIADLKADVKEVKKEQKEQSVETQNDIRALYRHISTGRPEPRLEKPVTVDGGSP